MTNKAMFNDLRIYNIKHILQGQTKCIRLQIHNITLQKGNKKPARLQTSCRGGETFHYFIALMNKSLIFSTKAFLSTISLPSRSMASS